MDMDIKVLIRRHVIFVILFLLAIADLSYAAANAPDFALHGEGNTIYRLADYKGKTVVLFFFSFDCGHCEKAMPTVKELNKKSKGGYEILGVAYGTSKKDLKYKKIEMGITFPVAVGSEKLKKDYNISDPPHFWVIGTDGALKERFFGEKGAGLLKEYLEAGKDTVGLFELSSEPKDYDGKSIETGGLLIQTSPSYFPKPVFMLTNGIERVRVSAWLPLEVAPVPKGFNRQRKKVMSDLLNKYVNVSGKVVLEDGKPFIEVKNGKASE